MTSQFSAPPDAVVDDFPVLFVPVAAAVATSGIVVLVPTAFAAPVVDFCLPLLLLLQCYFLVQPILLLLQKMIVM